MSSFFDQGSFNDRINRLWWNAEKYAPISADMVVSFVEPEFSSSSSDRSGDISAVFEQPDAVLSGRFTILGQIQATSANLTCEITGTQYEAIGSMDVTFIEPHLEMFPGHYVSCNFEPLEFQSVSFIKGEDVDNCIFKELTFFGTGESSYTSIGAQIRPMDCEMWTGNAVTVGLERPSFLAEGTPGLVGGINLTTKRLLMTALGGDPPSVTCSFLGMSMEMGGETPILANLSVTARKMTFLAASRSGIIAQLETRANPFFTNGWGGENHPVGKASLSFAPMRLKATGVYGGIGNIELGFMTHMLDMEGFYDGFNEVDLEMKTPVVELTSTGVTQCETYETLEFGGM